MTWGTIGCVVARPRRAEILAPTSSRRVSLCMRLHAQQLRAMVLFRPHSVLRRSCRTSDGACLRLPYTTLGGDQSMEQVRFGAVCHYARASARRSCQHGETSSARHVDHNAHEFTQSTAPVQLVKAFVRAAECDSV